MTTIKVTFFSRRTNFDFNYAEADNYKLKNYRGSRKTQKALPKKVEIQQSQTSLKFNFNTSKTCKLENAGFEQDSIQSSVSLDSMPKDEIVDVKKFSLGRFSRATPSMKKGVYRLNSTLLETASSEESEESVKITNLVNSIQPASGSVAQKSRAKKIKESLQEKIYCLPTYTKIGYHAYRVFTNETLMEYCTPMQRYRIILAQSLDKPLPHNVVMTKHMIPVSYNPESPDDELAVYEFSHKYHENFKNWAAKGDKKAQEYVKKIPTLFYCHGGGVLMYNPQHEYKQVCAYLALYLNIRVFAVNYRKGPFKADFTVNPPQDVYHTTKYMLDNHEKFSIYLDNFFLAGDSAGAALVLSILANMEDNQDCQKYWPFAVVCISPCSSVFNAFPSYNNNKLGKGNENFNISGLGVSLFLCSEEGHAWINEVTGSENLASLYWKSRHTLGNHTFRNTLNFENYDVEKYLPRVYRYDKRQQNLIIDADEYDVEKLNANFTYKNMPNNTDLEKRNRQIFKNIDQLLIKITKNYMQPYNVPKSKLENYVKHNPDCVYMFVGSENDHLRDDAIMMAERLMEVDAKVCYFILEKAIHSFHFFSSLMGGWVPSMNSQTKELLKMMGTLIDRNLEKLNL